MKSDGSMFTLENEELLITVERHGAQGGPVGRRPGSMEPPFTDPFSIYWKICEWKIPL